MRSFKTAGLETLHLHPLGGTEIWKSACLSTLRFAGALKEDMLSLALLDLVGARTPLRNALCIGCGAISGARFARLSPVQQDCHLFKTMKGPRTLRGISGEHF